MLRACLSFWYVYIRSICIDTKWIFLSSKFFCCINQTCIETRAKLFSFLFSLVPSDEEESFSVLFPNLLQLDTAIAGIKEKVAALTLGQHMVLRCNGQTVRPHGRIKIWEAGLLCSRILADFVNKGPKWGRTCILFNDSKSHKFWAFSWLSTQKNCLLESQWHLKNYSGAGFFFSAAESEFIIRTVRKVLETQNLFTKLVENTNMTDCISSP